MGWLTSLIPGVNWLQLGAGAVLGIAVSSAPIYLYGSHKGAVAERNAARAAAAIEMINRIESMEKNNEAFRDLPARERCLAFMRDSGLPVGKCDN